MEDKLVTLAILTYAKAQILKNVLENEGIETYIQEKEVSIYGTENLKLFYPQP